MVRLLNPRRLFSRFVACVVSAVCCLFPAVQSVSVIGALSSVLAPASLASLSLISPEAFAAAVDFDPAKTKGSDTARAVAGGITPPTLNASTGQVTINSTNPVANGQIMTGEQMLPGSTDPAKRAASNGNVSLFGDKANMGANSGTSSNNLLSSGPNDAYGNAYKTIRARAVQESHPDLSKEPIIGSSKSVLQGTDPNGFISSMTTACQTTTTPTQAPIMSHVSDLRTCNRTPETTGCRVTRPFSSYMFKPDETLFEFNGSMEHLLVFDIQVRTPTPLTYECIDCTLPQMEAGAAAAGIYFRVVNLQMGIDPSTLRISTVGASDWPDTPVGSLSATTMTVSQATPGFTHTYVTVQPDQSNGYIARVETYHGARGWGYTRESASVFVGYTTPLALVDNPTGCLQPRTNCTFGSVAWTNTGTTEDAASTDAWKCVNADYSRTIGPVNVGTGHWGQLGPLYPGEPMGGAPICYDAVARNYQCSYPQAPGPVDTCTPYEQDPQCKFLRSECEPSNVDPVTGRCIMHTQHWDCGVDTPVPGGTTTTTTTSCAGPIRCMGIECVEPTPPEKNPNFNQAAAQLGMVQWMDSDKDCVAGGNCTIFKGTGMSCRDVFWGVQNCCDSPTNTTLADYLKLTYYTYKLTNWTAVASYMESAGMGGLTSGFEALQSTLSTTWTDLTQPVVDAWQSLASDFMPDLASAVEDFSVDTIKDTAKEYLVEWGKQVFGEAFATYGGEAAVSSMIDSASVVVDFISTFMMYYAIAMILIQIIWACEPSEFELATKKELKSCHYIGAFCSQSVLSVCTEKSHSYCCYNSPLGRIIQEQVRAQLGLPWPTPEAVPVCDGLTIAQMQSVNWDAIDLTEWLGYLKLAGLHPNSVADGDTMYAGDRITTYVNAPGTQGMTTKDVTQQAIGAPNKPMNNVNQAATKMWGGLP